MQYKIEYMLQFSLANRVEPFLQCVSFSNQYFLVFTIVC